MKELFAGETSAFDDQRQSRPDGKLSASNFYQLSEKPFENNLDPRFLYLTPSYKEIFASILTWIKEGYGFAVITGEAGTGKTFFIHALLSHLDEKINPILVLNPVTTFKGLLEAIFLLSGQPTRGKTETDLFHHFTRFLDQMMGQGKTLLVILDEAQGLNDQILHDIEHFLDLRSKLIRIIFVGQPHFDERLNLTKFRRLGQKIETRRKIEPLTEEESRGYIDHRLRLVGSSSEIMTPEAISMICSYARGVSSLINHVCDNALWVGCNMNRKKVDVDIIEKIIQNLDGPKIIPKTFPALHLRWIWTSPTPLAESLKRVLIAIFPKVIPNLEGLRIVSKILPSIQLKRIWKSSNQFVISLRRISMPAFLKVRQNLQGLRIMPKIIPSIQLRWIWKSPAQFAISFKRGLIAIFPKVIQNLQAPRIIPKTFPAIQLKRIWRFPTQFAISLRIGLMVFFPKAIQNLRGPKIIPKTSPAFHLRWIWKSPIQFTMSSKRVSMALFLKVISNLEGLRIIPNILPSIQLRRIWTSPRQFAISLKRISMAAFLLVCLGGLIFLCYEYIGRGSMNIQVRKPFIGQELATRPSMHKPPVQQTTEGILEKDRVPTSDEQKVTLPESSSLQRDPVLLSPRKGKQKPTGVKVDEKSNVAFSPKEEGLLPPLESASKKDDSGEAPKLVDNVSRTSETQEPKITHFFATDKGPYGCIWQIYIEAEDPKGDMDRISVEVDQVNYGHYPTDWIRIKPEHRKHLTGFIQWNTFSSKTSYLPEGTQISVKVSIFDQAGNKSNEVIIPFTFRSGSISRYQLPAPFDRGNIPRIGYLMIDLS